MQRKSSEPDGSGAVMVLGVIILGMFVSAVIFAHGCKNDAYMQEKAKHDHEYILGEAARPSSLSQEQWDTLNRYLKKVDELERKVNERQTTD